MHPISPLQVTTALKQLQLRQLKEERESIPCPGAVSKEVKMIEAVFTVEINKVCNRVTLGCLPTQYWPLKSPF